MIIKKVDSLGRIVIPKGLRDILNIKENDKLIISLKDNKIVIEKAN